MSREQCGAPKYVAPCRSEIVTVHDRRFCATYCKELRPVQDDAARMPYATCVVMPVRPPFASVGRARSWG
jgi:hypothetical protein